MHLQLQPERQEKIEKIFEVAIIIAALATMPLTYVHMQQIEGWWVLPADWIVWSVFAAEFAFAMAVSTNRWQTTKKQWLNVAIVILSFPLLHNLLGLTRLARLLRPIRLIGGIRIGRPFAVLRLYVVRSAGSKRAMKHARKTGPGQAVAEKAEDVKERAAAHAPGVGHPRNRE